VLGSITLSLVVVTAMVSPFDTILLASLEQGSCPAAASRSRISARADRAGFTPAEGLSRLPQRRAQIHETRASAPASSLVA